MSAEPEQGEEQESRKLTLGLTIVTLGVVFGDIGTSPLYAMRECFHGAHAVPPTTDNVLGVLSLIVWSLIFVVSLKYLTLVMQAHNRGEGGTLALLALLRPARSEFSRWQRRTIVTVGLFGTALVYGDGIITPAISVLSAIEGLEIATPLFAPYIVPITIAVLLSIFLVQPHGTGRIGRVFGPIILIWFLVLAILGLRGVISNPQVLWAVNPVYGFHFLSSYGWESLWVLGAVFLVVTGSEALYADMGHFGATAIRVSWFSIVLPGLALNYMGQGALILSNPSTVSNPFYFLVPAPLLYPMVLLATFATIIASQALIAGAFSITKQAIQLGYIPRLEMHHTSSEEIGQIYVPFVNWMLLLFTVGLVLEFRSSSALAAAYGIAVATVAIITTGLTVVVARTLWGWSRLTVILLVGVLLLIDIAFFTANMLKLPQGGYMPLLVASGIFTVMMTWKEGRALLAARLRSVVIPKQRFMRDIVPTIPQRLPGTAIFMARSPDITPPALFLNVKHNLVLHEQVILLSVETEEIPKVPPRDRLELERHGDGIYSVRLHFGFMEIPDVPRCLRRLSSLGVVVDLENVTYVLSRETIVATDLPGMAIWRERLFAFLSRNARRAASYFGIPAHQVIEIGRPIEI
ncbi:MAG: potassium transporter Kup [Bdellovibrionota bacterium]|nr:MAG: potassium transporter Kup [Bdellovibrionota bacterium]